MSVISPFNLYLIEESLSEILREKLFENHPKASEFRNKLDETKSLIYNIMKKPWYSEDNPREIDYEDKVNLERAYFSMMPILDYLSGINADLKVQTEFIRDGFIDILEYSVNIAALLPVEDMMKNLFVKIKDSNLEDKTVSELTRKLVVMSHDISGLLKKYLPLNYVLSRYTGEKVEAPDFISAPYFEASYVLAPAERDLDEIITLAGPDGINMSEEFLSIVQDIRNRIRRK